MLLNCGIGEDLRGPWTARRPSQSILKEINPEYSLEGLMLKLQFFGHLMWRTHSFEKILMLGKTEVSRRQGQQRTRWLDGITTQHTWVWASSSSWWCHPTISPSVVPFSCLQSFPAPESFPTSQFFTSGGQSIGASASVLPVNIQDWFSLGLMGLICPWHPVLGQSCLTLEAKSHIYVLIYNIYFSLSDFPHCL